MLGVIQISTAMHIHDASLVAAVRLSSKCIAKLEEKSSAKLRSSMDEFKAWAI